MPGMAVGLEVAGGKAPESPDVQGQPMAAQPASGSASVGQSAVSQISGALVGVGPIPNAGNQTQAVSGIRLTIAMAPPAIGMVTVQIDRRNDGTAAIAVTATHSATFAALQGDQATLVQALAQAGVAVDRGNVAFHLVAPQVGFAQQQAQNISGQGLAGQGFAAPGNGGQFGAGSGQNGGRPQGEPFYGTTFAYSSSGSSGGPSEVSNGALPQRAMRMRRFGLNVMA